MNEVEFRSYLLNKGFQRKSAGDAVSRLKRIERELSPCDIDKEYRKDRCERLMKLFSNRGMNEDAKIVFENTKFPVGKYYMSSYRHALRIYVEFCDNN